jgi:hypothetical protein
MRGSIGKKNSDIFQTILEIFFDKKDPFPPEHQR